MGRLRAAWSCLMGRPTAFRVRVVGIGPLQPGGRVRLVEAGVRFDALPGRPGRKPVREP